jgi:hypothetical protein
MFAMPPLFAEPAYAVQAAVRLASAGELQTISGWVVNVHLHLQLCSCVLLKQT